MRTVVLVLLLAGTICARPPFLDELKAKLTHDVTQDVMRWIANIEFKFTPVEDEKRELQENLVEEFLKLLELFHPVMVTLIQGISEGKREFRDDWIAEIKNQFEHISDTIVSHIPNLTGGNGDLKDLFSEIEQIGNLIIQAINGEKRELEEDWVEMAYTVIDTFAPLLVTFLQSLFAGKREVEENMFDEIIQELKVFISDLIEGSATTAVTREETGNFLDQFIAVLQHLFVVVAPLVMNVINGGSK